MPRPTRYVSRKNLGWSATSPAGYANPRSGLVIHYDSSNSNLAGKPHSACVTYWHNTRAFHTGPERGWDDVGYSFFACPHGYVLEGRGLYRAQAAQPGGNTSHYSCTLAGGPSDTITEDQINAVRELRQWLMEPDTSIAGAVLGHRDFNSTSCPGDRAYALVTNGTFTKPPGAVTSGDDDMGILDLSKGDSGRRVATLQNMLRRIGRHQDRDLLPKYGVDSDYGQEVSDAVLWVRKNLHGSTATDGDTITSYAYDQVWTSYIRAAQTTTSGGDGGGALPAKATISGTVNLKGA